MHKRFDLTYSMAFAIDDGHFQAMEGGAMSQRVVKKIVMASKRTRSNMWIWRGT